MATATHRRPRSEQRQDPSGAGLTTYIPATVAVLFCAFVIWMAAPVFWHSVIAQRSIETINAMKRGDDVSTERMMATLEAIGPVDVDNPPIGDRLINQGILSLAIALRLSPSDSQHIAYLSQAKALAEARLRRAPADTHAWARLAMAEYLLNGPTELAIEALRTSFQTGPYEYYALMPRLELGANLWPLLDEEMRADTATQAAMLWRVRNERWVVVRKFVDFPSGLQLMIAAEMANLPDRDEFERMVEQERQRRDQD